MKHICTILALALAAALSGAAKTFDWPVDAPTAGARQFTAYHGETVRFNLRFRGAMTNLAPVCIYYQTNGMGRAEWFGPVPGTVFAPSNDCGAAAYRFFILCNDPDGKDYTANGTLRMLDSPGFEPNELPLPVKVIDFAAVEVRNPPWGDALTTNDVCAIVTNEVPCEFSAWSYERTDGLPYPVEVTAEAEYRQGCWIAYLDQERVEDLEAPPDATTLHLRGFYGDYYIATRSVLATRNALGLARLSDIEDVATNAAVGATSRLFRPLGDDQVYEPTGMSAFEWSSARSDILAALGAVQPYVDYSDGEMRQYALEFSLGPTNYYGYAWASAYAPEVEFWLDGYYWGPDGDGYDAAIATGRRRATGYRVEEPVDRFARQSAVATVRSEVASLRTWLDGETKVMRTGREGQYGHGWGYLRHSPVEEVRYWRIRAPAWGGYTGMATNNMTATAEYWRARDDAARVAGFTYPYPVLLANPLSFHGRWGMRRTLRETRGLNGGDAVAMADWDVGVFLASTNGGGRCVANYAVRQTSASPAAFEVTPNASGMVPWEVEGRDRSVTGTWLRRDLDLPTVTRTWSIYVGGYSRQFTVAATVRAVLLEPGTVSCGDGTIRLAYWTVADYAVDCAALNHHGRLHDVKVRHTVTATCASQSALEDVVVPYYRLVSSVNSDLHYDAAADVTWRIVCSNGCFYSEWHMDGDWRKEAP